MAKFVKGELITAQKLNEVNSTTGNISVGQGQFKNATKSIGPVYMYSYSYFEVASHAYNSIGVLVNGDSRSYVTIDKLENSNWVTVKTDDFVHPFGENRNAHYYYISDIGGEGWYRITVRNKSDGKAFFPPIVFILYECHSDTSFSANGLSQTNCVKGDYLVCVDHPQSSANYIRGELLTADLLNSGRVGTRRVL